MKKIKNILFLLSLSLILTNCGDEDGYTVTESQRGPNFTETAVNVPIPEEGLLLDLPIIVSSLSTTDRVYDIEVVEATGASSEFTLLSAVVPANQVEGVAQISFDFDAIADSEPRRVVLSLSNEGGAPSNEITIDYFRAVVCNDLNITINSDRWASETYFSVETADGTVIVDRFFPFSSDLSAASTTGVTYSQDFNLDDGDYVFKLGDAFGDGQVSANYNGDYALTCSILTHASGDGAFTVSTADPFPGAPNATVEVTEFSINQ